MIRFRFELRPVERRQAWVGGSASWFAMTDGWYDIDVGSAELLRYAHATPDPFEAHVDYYVARLREDLLDLLPTILEPVSDDLADRDDVAASQWRDSRTLDLGYLAESPRISIWRSTGSGGDLVTVAWTSPPVFAAPEAGRMTVPQRNSSRP